MSRRLTARQNHVLAVLASKPGASYAPVQVQKLFFLMDENLPALIEKKSKHFRFEPYDYGPFDKAVYHELEALASADLVKVENALGTGAQRRYSLTPEGYATGRERFEQLPERARDYVSRVADWVSALSFSELVGAIYRAYPDMRENSIFRD